MFSRPPDTTSTSCFSWRTYQKYNLKTKEAAYMATAMLSSALLLLPLLVVKLNSAILVPESNKSVAGSSAYSLSTDGDRDNSTFFHDPTTFLFHDNTSKALNDTTPKHTSHHTRGRNGRMLDLDTLVGDYASAETNRARLQSGNRRSRYLSPNQPSLDIGNGKKLHIQGFIPIVTMKDEDEANQERKQQPFPLPEASHMSIGHASFPTSVQRYLNTGEQQVEAKFSSGSVVENLRRPIKKLTSLVSDDSSSQQQQNCLCVPFYMCKNGYVSESSLGKSQLQQLIAQQQTSNAARFQHQELDGKSGHLLQTQRALSNSDVPQLTTKEPIYADSMVPVDERSFNRDLVTLMPSINGLEDNHSLNQTSDLIETRIDSDDTFNNSTISDSSIASQYSQDILGRMLGLRVTGHKQQSFGSPGGVCGLLRTCCNISTQQQHQYLSQQELENAEKFISQQLGSSSELKPARPYQSPAPSNQRISVQPYSAQQQNQLQQLQVLQQLANQARLLQLQQMNNPANTLPETTMIHRSNQFLANHYPPQPMRGVQPTQLQPLYQHQQKISPLYNPHMQAQNTRVITRKILEGRCGQRQTSGISGRVQSLQYHDSAADFGEYPAQAAILKKLNGADSLFVCGGTLISQYWVATAAHCIRKHALSDIKVRLGEWDVHRDDEFYPFVEREVRNIVIHPEFVPNNLVNDIALIRLSSAVDANLPHINPACLPEINENFAGQRCWVTGWGKDSFGQRGAFQAVLKEVELPVTNHGECEMALRGTRLGPLYRLHPGFICAGGEGGRDACEGDGGSGLYCVQDGLLKVAGLVSWGIGCGQQGVPGVYVSLAYYRPWIENIISIDEDIYSPYHSLTSSSLIGERSNSMATAEESYTNKTDSSPSTGDAPS